MRRFNILDAVLLVAAIAVGLALCRTKLTNFLPPPPRGLLLPDRFRYARDSLLNVAPVLCACTGGCLILRLRRPRPPARLLADFPGSSAVVAASCVIALQTALMVLEIIGGARPDFVITPFSHNFYSNPGFAVVGAWSVVIVGGRWRFERSWIDWLGFALGLAWIGLVLALWGSFVLIR
jgi:hypothetical protein